MCMLLPLRSSKQCAPKSFDKIVLSNLLKVSNDIKLMKNIKIIQFQNSHTNIFCCSIFLVLDPSTMLRFGRQKHQGSKLGGKQVGV